MTIEKMEIKVSRINTVPVLLTNLSPKRRVMTKAPRRRKLKNLMEKAKGPKLKPVTTWIASMAPKIDMAEEKVVAK
jgi:hypothetical protein